MSLLYTIWWFMILTLSAWRFKASLLGHPANGVRIVGKSTDICTIQGVEFEKGWLRTSQRAEFPWSKCKLRIFQNDAYISLWPASKEAQGISLLDNQEDRQFWIGYLLEKNISSSRIPGIDGLIAAAMPCWWTLVPLPGVSLRAKPADVGLRDGIPCVEFGWIH